LVLTVDQEVGGSNRLRARTLLGPKGLIARCVRLLLRECAENKRYRRPFQLIYRSRG
jgi:hypothetical protein